MVLAGYSGTAVPIGWLEWYTSEEDTGCKARTHSCSSLVPPVCVMKKADWYTKLSDIDL